ncbi:DAK2 domain-containing protein [Chloroflexota bacterium]
MKRIESINGQELREMLATATGWLEKNSQDIDALNVFPVPDGDTGTNMLLTMRSGIEESYRAPDSSASAVCQAIAKGALMGARGNSGVILSQIWRGLAHGLEEKKSFNGTELADALQEASAMAYKGISNPVEGTILTVIKDVAEATQTQVASGKDDPISVIEAAVNAANESVANTPVLLSVLKNAGVVDAGGHGLYTILEGALRHLRGEAELMQFRKPQMIASNLPQPLRLPQMDTVEEVPYGYCTEFMIRGENLKSEKVKARLEKKGQSLIAVGDETTLRVHIHTTDPGGIIHYANGLGTMHQISIRNMDEQHQDWLEMQKERVPIVDIATIAVVAGDGLSEVFTSLGATAIVPGGKTMNPSVKDLLQAVKSVVSDKIIILPNNKNVVLTAEQIPSLTEKEIKVVSTQTIPQGVAALLAFDYEADFETNAQLMGEARLKIKTIEVSHAVRSTKVDRLKIKKKQAIGFLDGELLAAGSTITELIRKILAELHLSKYEIITIYYGVDTEAVQAEQIGASILEQYPQFQIEVVRGGQPHYDYIVSVE